MVTVSRRVLLPLLALIVAPAVCFVLAPNPIQAGETPSFLLVPLSLPNVSLPQSLRAYGLEDDATEELAMLSQQVMPNEEFGIVYPGSETESPTEGGHAGDCSKRPNIRGRV